MTAGLSPVNAYEVNANVGAVLRQFTDVRAIIHQHWSWLAAEDLKVPPYEMSADDETLIKSALGPLDEDLKAIDMTFISRLIGLPTT